MSAQSLSQTVLAAIFALFGGSLLAFFEKLSVNGQTKASVGLLAISLGALVGVYSGVYINEHQLLTPLPLRTKSEPTKYLRENVLTDINAIDSKYRTGILTAKEAYEQLHAALEKRY